MFSGAAIVLRTMNLVIVEGGPKAQKKFKRLMLHRIKWEEDEVDKKRKKYKTNTDDSVVKMNKCSLAWEVS